MLKKILLTVAIVVVSTNVSAKSCERKWAEYYSGKSWFEPWCNTESYKRRKAEDRRYAEMMDDYYDDYYPNGDSKSEPKPDYKAMPKTIINAEQCDILLDGECPKPHVLKPEPKPKPRTIDDLTDAEQQQMIDDIWTELTNVANQSLINGSYPVIVSHKFGVGDRLQLSSGETGTVLSVFSYVGQHCYYMLVGKEKGLYRISIVDANGWLM